MNRPPNAHRSAHFAGSGGRIAMNEAWFDRDDDQPCGTNPLALVDEGQRALARAPAHACLACRVHRGRPCGPGRVARPGTPRRTTDDRAGRGLPRHAHRRLLRVATVVPLRPKAPLPVAALDPGSRRRARVVVPSREPHASNPVERLPRARSPCLGAAFVGGRLGSITPPAAYPVRHDRRPPYRCRAAPAGRVQRP